MLSTSNIVLQNLIFNGDYSSRVIPFIETEYFETKEEKILFDHVRNYTEKYQALPTLDALKISIQEDKSVVEKIEQNIHHILDKIKDPTTQNFEWLIQTTEKFCQDRAMHNAIMKAVEVYSGEEKNLSAGAIPDLMKDALSITFNSTLGHDYVADAEHRYEYYHRQEIKVPFDLDYLNRITRNGFSKKTLNIILAGTHTGKSALMCHMAAANLRAGRNVLYITLEMAEEEISKRIDANVMDLTIDEVMNIPKETFMNKVNKLKSKTTGKLIVKEYPMSSAHIGHFRSLLNDLRLKQKFEPEIVYIDYINICASSRFKAGGNHNSYTIMKAVSEELRALSTERNLPIVSASQFNRGGADNTDPGMGDISESFAVNFGADFICAMVASDDLKAQGKVLFKQLKNRYDDMGKVPKFFIGFDRGKMKFYDVDDATDGMSHLNSATPQVEQTTSAKALQTITDKSKKFGGFKF